MSDETKILDPEPAGQSAGEGAGEITAAQTTDAVQPDIASEGTTEGTDQTAAGAANGPDESATQTGNAAIEASADQAVDAPATDTGTDEAVDETASSDSAEEVNPATGETDEARLERGTDNEQAEPQVDPEPVPEQTVTTNLDWAQARKQAHQITQWANANGVQHDHNDYGEWFKLIHPPHIQLPDWLVGLVKSVEGVVNEAIEPPTDDTVPPSEDHSAE